MAIKGRRLDLLLLVFWTMLAVRMVFPFIIQPQDWLYSDPLRHWRNGVNILNPGMISGIDAKPYQLWLLFLRHIAPNPSMDFPISLFVGLLCASMPWLWYKACREFLPRRPSLVLAIVIGLYPPLLTIYGYFMTETLLLNLLGLSLWMTLRCRRKQTEASYYLALVCWLLTALTRLAALPMGLLGIGYVLLTSRQNLFKRAVFSALIAAAFIIPAGLHSYRAMHIFSPFHFSLPNKIYRLAGTENYAYRTDDEHHLFACPCIYEMPFYPFRYTNTRRDHRMEQFYVNKDKGREDWEKKYAEVKAAYTLQRFRDDMRDNAVYFLFGASWPESQRHGVMGLPLKQLFSKNARTGLGVLGFHLRWIWAPIIFLVLLYAPYVRVKEKASLVLLITWCLILLMFTQQMGLMEGRFRKPLEPLLFISAYLILHALGRGGEGPRTGQPALFYFAWKVYVTPLLEYLRVCAAFFTGTKQKFRFRK